MVTIARYSNVTLIVPALDKTSFWADPRLVDYLELCIRGKKIFLFTNVRFNSFGLSSILSMSRKCGSDFQDIFDVDHFITSLKDEIRILRELPPRLKRRVEQRRLYSLSPISWSNMSYYLNQVGSVHAYVTLRPFDLKLVTPFVLVQLMF